jgi:DNA-binding FadR family transcriptional regulator
MATGRGQRLHRDVLERLIARIVGGEIQPGEMLPREVDLMQEYDVSRGVARETVRALEERGLVSVKHGIGAFVNDRSRWEKAHKDVLGARMKNDPEATTRDCEECWGPLIIQAAELAALRTPTGYLPHLWETLADMDRYASRPTTGGFRPATVPFFTALLKAAGNEALEGWGTCLLSILSTAPSSSIDPYRIQTELVPLYRNLLSNIQSASREEAGNSMSRIRHWEQAAHSSVETHAHA